MEDDKKAGQEVTITGETNYAFLETDFEELYKEYAVAKPPTADAATQTEARPVKALLLMKYEIHNLPTPDKAEAYRQQLAIAVELLHIKYASLVHRVEFRKMAKWKPVQGSGSQLGPRALLLVP